jgi:hypothetical protein
MANFVFTRTVSLCLVRKSCEIALIPLRGKNYLVFIRLCYFSDVPYSLFMHPWYYRGADKSLARPGRKKVTVTEDFDIHLSYLSPKLEEY